MSKKDICKICKVNDLNDDFEKSLCMHCGEPFCAQCINSKIDYCPCCGKNMNEKNCFLILKNLLKIENKIKGGKISNPERISKYLYICIAGMYLKGEGCKKDWKKTEEYYLKSSRLGNPVADFNLYCIYHEMGRGKELYNKYLERSVKAGFSKALFSKALRFKPRLTNQDFMMRSAMTNKNLHQFFKENPDKKSTILEYPNDALELLSRSVKGKCRDAIFEWAVMIQFGNTPDTSITSYMSEETVSKKIDQNVNKSIFWYKLAASLGHGLAMNNLGFIYKNGLHNGKPDFEKAYEYYYCSHENGCENGTFGVGTIWEERAEALKNYRITGIFSQEKIEKMKEEEKEFYRQASRFYGYAGMKNFTPAIFQLGFLMVNQILSPNVLIGDTEIYYDDMNDMRSEGMVFIRQAASEGDIHAQKYLQNKK